MVDDVCPLGVSTIFCGTSKQRPVLPCEKKLQISPLFRSLTRWRTSILRELDSPTNWRLIGYGGLKIQLKTHRAGSKWTKDML